MPVALNRTTLELRPSANEPDHPAEEWIIDPDLSAVDGWPVRYWQISGDTVSLADEATRATIDAAATEAELAEYRSEAAAALMENRDFRSLTIRAVALVVLDEINALRAEHSLPARTRGAMLTAVANKIATMQADA